MPCIIPGSISPQDFAAVSGMTPSKSRRMLEYLVQNGIGKNQSGSVEFTAGDRLRAALLAIRLGVNPPEVSERLSWQDFEGLVSEMLDELGFAVMKGFMLKNPRRQIDVIGIRAGVALVIDCKHWSKSTESALVQAAQKQAERTKQYVSQTPGAMAVPALITLYDEQIRFAGRVPIVPVSRLESFVDQLYGNMDGISIGT